MHTIAAVQLPDFSGGRPDLQFSFNGIYDFRDGSQHGVGQNSIVMVRYDAARDEFVTVSKRGGSPK